MENIEQNTEEEAKVTLGRKRGHRLNFLKSPTLLLQHKRAEGKLHFLVTWTTGLTFPQNWSEEYGRTLACPFPASHSLQECLSALPEARSSPYTHSQTSWAPSLRARVGPFIESARETLSWPFLQHTRVNKHQGVPFSPLLLSRTALISLCQTLLQVKHHWVLE